MRVSQRAAGMPAQPLALHAADVAEVDRVFARSDARVPITIDPAARRLVLDSAAVTAQDIDHAWADWMLLGDNRKYPPAFTSAGGDDHGGALYIPAYNLLENDWRVGPMESAHDLTITGKLFVRGGGVPVFNTLGTYQINVNCPVPVQAQGIATSGGAGATAAEGWAYGSRTLTSTDCPTASAIADAVWSRDIGTGSMPFRVERQSSWPADKYLSKSGTRSALCRFARPRHPMVAAERVSRQGLQARQAQVGDGDEVLGRAVSARCALGLLKLPVHRLDEGVAAVIEHAAHDRVEALLDRGRPAS
jgi:hypothetical protein